MAFTFLIEAAAIERGNILALRGELRGGRIYDADLIRIQTTQGVNLVARVIMLRAFNGLYWPLSTRPGDPFILHVIPPYNPALIRTGLAEWTSMQNDAAACNWIRQRIQEQGETSVYIYDDGPA